MLAATGPRRSGRASGISPGCSATTRASTVRLWEPEHQQADFARTLAPGARMGSPEPLPICEPERASAPTFADSRARGLPEIVLTDTLDPSGTRNWRGVSRDKNEVKPVRVIPRFWAFAGCRGVRKPDCREVTPV